MYYRLDGTVRTRALLKAKEQAELEKKCKTIDQDANPTGLGAADGLQLRRTPAQSRAVLTLLNQAEVAALQSPARSRHLLLQAMHMFAETHVIAKP